VVVGPTGGDSQVGEALDRVVYTHGMGSSDCRL
jgi:hypothetical protein